MVTTYLDEILMILVRWGENGWHARGPDKLPYVECRPPGSWEVPVGLERC